VAHFKFLGPNDISETAKVRVVKFCIQVDYIIAKLKDDKPPLKGEWSGSHDPFFKHCPNHIFGNGDTMASYDVWRVTHPLR